MCPMRPILSVQLAASLECYYPAFTVTTGADAVLIEAVQQ